MNALILLFAWLAALVGGTDPCDNTAYAEANAGECNAGITVQLPYEPSVTDISNGF